ncbi:hypothetical protein H6P81_000203 [Aristolochia fimbriata]|uniref:Uncharacterized protein n=1 Tax=Aristolochia fimbriata TaxID=158543 RepID=A0AAV7F5W2_ARIFI|nr:hypothetical protein H6P81_000203 [Aristolochia fimbriata]
MPGAIQVSVLGLMDLPASLTSLVSVKVAIGKREFQTPDKGDFSFPLNNLRDILNVALCDAEGNEISRIDIQTKTVVEKGVWEDLFPFKGGGLVHMKLLFNLNEEERKRIREMRESILRRKQVQLEKKSTASSETSKDSSFQPNDDNQSFHSEKTTPMEDLYKNFIEDKGPSTGDMSRIPPAVRSSQNAADPQLECLKPFPSVNTHKKGSIPLTPGGDGISSNNVRKMISALENTLSQTEVLATRAPVEKAEIERKSQTRIKQSSTGLLGENLYRPNWSRSTYMQKAETSDANELSSTCRIIEGREKADVQDKVKQDMCASSNQKQERQALGETKYGTIESLHGWLFYSNSRHVCITTAGKQVRDFLDVNHMESETDHTEAELSEKESNAPHDLRQQEHGYSDDPAKDVGLFEQVLKITVILVCGTLFISTARGKNR